MRGRTGGLIVVAVVGMLGVSACADDGPGMVPGEPVPTDPGTTEPETTEPGTTEPGTT